MRTRINPDRRTRVTCDNCGGEFMREQNTRYCSAICRLVGKVARIDACWVWRATLDRHGYGTFYMDGRNMPAHRASFILHGGTIPAARELDHPDHLEPVTRRINVLRGAAPTAVAWREGRCKNGHPRTPDNTYVRSERSRQCRICMHASRAKREGRAA